MRCCRTSTSSAATRASPKPEPVCVREQRYGSGRRATRRPEAGVLGAIDEIAEKPKGAAQLRRERRDQGCADAGGDDGGPVGDRRRHQHFGDCGADVAHLLVGDAAGGFAPVCETRLRPVAAETAGKAR